MDWLKRHGSFIVFLGAFCWSLNSPFVKGLTISAFLILFLRSVIAGTVLLPFLRPKKLRWDKWMFIFLASFAAVCICVIVSLKLTDASIAIGMQYTAILWLTLADIIRNRSLKGQPWLAVGLVMIGLILFMTSGSGMVGSPAGIALSILEGIVFAIMTATSKRAGQDNPIGVTSIACYFTALVVLLISPSTVLEIADMDAVQWILIFILGTVQVGAGYAFYNLGLQYVSPQRASVLALTELVLGPLWVILFLHEYSSFQVLAGLAFIVGGILVNSVGNTLMQKIRGAAD